MYPPVIMNNLNLQMSF